MSEQFTVDKEARQLIASEIFHRLAIINRRIIIVKHTELNADNNSPYKKTDILTLQNEVNYYREQIDIIKNRMEMIVETSKDELTTEILNKLKTILQMS